MIEDLRDVFVVIKGQYAKRGDKFFNEVSGDYNYIGGYDPENSSTSEWYMLVDTTTYTTLACGSNLEKVVGCAKKYITKYQTLDRYQKMLRSLEYSGKPSPIHARLMKEVCDTYGGYYRHLITGVEDSAYEQVREENINRSFKKAKKVLGKKRPKTLEVISTPPTPEVFGEVKSMVKPLKKKGVRKLSL